MNNNASKLAKSSDNLASIQAEATQEKAPNHTLNHQQKKAVKAVIDWYASSEKYFRFCGYAGTGKTYTAAVIVLALQKLYPTIKIKGIAPSHKAKRQLKRSLESAGIFSVEYSSIAGHLGKAPDLDKATGKEKFKKQEKGIYAEIDYDLILCDEWGMIGTDDTEDLLSGEYKAKILFLGDGAQLPPVGEKFSPIGSYNWQTAMLDDVVRYSGQIKEVAYSYIGPKYQGDCLPIRSDDGTIITLESKQKAIELYTEDLAIAYETNNFDYCKMINFTNKAAKANSEWIRSIYFNNPQLPYIVGDRLLERKPIQRKNEKNKWNIVLENSTEFKVLSNATLHEIKIDGITYEYWQVLAQPDDYASQIALNILADGQDRLISDHLKRAREVATKSRKWDVVTELSKAFDDVAYAYAITCHKAQGSTYQYVYLDLPDLKKCPDRKQMLYTAITRTSRVLHVFNI